MSTPNTPNNQGHDPAKALFNELKLKHLFKEFGLDSKDKVDEPTKPTLETKKDNVANPTLKTEQEIFNQSLTEILTAADLDNRQN